MEKKAQVWVETVIYTLIGLAIIGILLAVSKPKIDSMKDELVIEQSLESVSEIDKVIRGLSGLSVGNKRIAEFKISKGYFYVDGANDTIYLVIDSKKEYSQIDEDVPVGDLKVRTEEKGDLWEVTISADYSDKGIDLTFGGQNVEKRFEAAPSAYSLSFENKGSSGGKVVVDVSG